MSGLSEREADLLRFVQGWQAARGYGPSLAEIAAGIGLSAVSKATVWRMLAKLEAAGMLRRLTCRARAIEVVVPIAIPRAPDGAPLYLVRLGGGG